MITMGAQSSPLHALSVDVEDWYQVSAYAGVVDRGHWDDYESRVLANTHRVLELLASHDVLATFFVLGWEAERCPELVQSIHAQGHEVACHGYSHRPLYEMTPAEFRSELDRACDAISSVTGAHPLGFRAPDFSVGRSTIWALDVLAEHGFSYDSSIYPVDFMRYGIPEFPPGPTRVRMSSGRTIDEMPITSYRIAGKNLGAGGGAYLRILPPQLTRRGLQQAERAGRSGCLYFHPWELDPEQPRQDVPKRTNFRHLHNTDRMVGRVAEMLERFRFVPIAKCLELNQPAADWPSVDTRNLVSPATDSEMLAE